ncbi:hypothetical protein [Candidatus Protochlamydia phocaeensis]|uniref:hypothetical protein n=1 Tax=Candidatus Protochlamydia phocaeensis TaxID=1414722 RepID=UPI000B223AA0|nr:hypothetical protein [Candidatus Protochlamydia phocaeensis]
MRQWKIIIKALLVLACLNAQLKGEEEAEEQMVITSGEAEYNGQEISLVGTVEVQHGLGKISAHRLIVMPSDQGNKKSRFSLLKISDDVRIELQGGGQLHCQQAEVDSLKLQGIFLGNARQPDVIYSNAGERDGQTLHARAPLIVKSEQMQFNLIRQPSEGKLKTLVQSIQANQNVRVHYNQDYLLLADQAFYQRLPSQMSPTKGLLTLSAGLTHPVCQATNLNGDRIQSQSIVVDTVQRSLHLTQPQGTLYTLSKDQQRQNVRFNADELTWFDTEQRMHLKGHIRIDQEGIAHVKTDHEADIQRGGAGSKKNIRSIVSSQDTELTYMDSKKGIAHRVVCCGPVEIDHEKYEMRMQSPTDLQGEVQEGKQIYFENALGDMYADRMHLVYSLESGKMVPAKITLEGHVQMLNRFDGHFQESSSVLQYALADRVEFFPAVQEILLSSSPGSRVLFFDKVNNVKMSAPSLKIRHDEKSQKGSIQGIGDVRFTFIEKEMDQLRQRFRLDDKSQ